MRVPNVLNGVLDLCWNWTKWIYYFDALTLLMKIVRSFRWRKFSSVGREGWYEKMNDGQKIKLGDSHVTPKTYPRSTRVKAWGCPRHPLLHQQKYQVSFKTLYFYSFTWYVLFLERHFCFSFSLVLFSCCNKWLDPRTLVWRETCSVFIA